MKNLLSTENTAGMADPRKETMRTGCSIRALWILNSQDAVVFSRRFVVVERRWRAACARKHGGGGDGDDEALFPYLPTDSELTTAFADRRKREGSVRGYGVRTSQSVKGSDSWIDDPITRSVISVTITKDGGESHLLWPIVLHMKGPFRFLAMPLVEPYHLKTYARMLNRSDCGSAVGEDESLSSLLLDLPTITGALMVIHVIADIVTGDIVEPEVVVNSSPSVGGLLDSLTGSIGITARTKPAGTPNVASGTSGASAGGAVASDTPKVGSRPFDKDALQSFLSSAMPFGTPLDLSYSNISSMKTNGFSSTDLPPADGKQPAWKPYLYRGKQRILFTIHETIHVAMYDRDEIPDSVAVSGQVNCRAELEGLPDVSFPLKGLESTCIEVLSFHPCAQVPEHGGDRHAMTFSPPLGNFALMRYQVNGGIRPPVKGFYQLSMVSEDEGAFLFKLRLMEGYKSPLSLEFCTVSMPFPRRRVVAVEGTPSIGLVSTTEHSVEWKIIFGGRGVSGKSIEATFSGTLKFAPWQTKKLPSSLSAVGGLDDEDSDFETESANNMVNVEDFLMEKMKKDLQAADLEEPFCWQAYSYAKVSFKMTGSTLSGMSIDPKSLSIFPAVKAPVELSAQVTSGDYILWNTLGKCPVVATPKP